MAKKVGARSFRPIFTEDAYFAEELFTLAGTEGLGVSPKYACEVVDRATGNAVVSVALAKEIEGGYFAVVANGFDGETYDLYTNEASEARECFVRKSIEVAADLRW